MSLCYLFSPLHSEFNILLHKISHQFVIEDHHAKDANEKHHNAGHHDHKFLSSNPSEKIEEHHEKDEIEEHTHDLISFVNSIFNKDSSEDNRKKHIFEHQIDKHIQSNKIDLPQPVLVYKVKNLWGYYSFAESPEPEITIPPPQRIPA